MQKLVTYILILSCYTQLKSQDSIAYTKDFNFYEGLYLNYQDFRKNWSISKEKIIADIKKNQLDFFSKVIESEKIIEYQNNDGAIEKIDVKNIWGYSQNNMIYINHDGNFFRIPVFGAICSFIGTIEVIEYSARYDPYINTPTTNTTTKTKEMRQYLFDFYSGEISLFSIEKLEEMFKRDETIYKEFGALNKKKKKETSNKYIRMYNEKHSVYFPKN